MKYQRLGESGRTRQGGQSLVELAIFLPILLLLFLGIADLARLYATMIAIESAARDSADFGANGGPGGPENANPKWSDALQADTVAMMERMACTPALGLAEYVGAADGSTCTNPAFSCTIAGGACTTPTNCDEDGVGPCAIEVTLTYAYDVIVPGGILGLPATITFTRNSIFNLAEPQTVSGP